jgi:hypothetical protein
MAGVILYAEIIIFLFTIAAVLTCVCVRAIFYQNRRDQQFIKLANKFSLQVTYDYKQTSAELSRFGGQVQKLRTLFGVINGKNVTIQDQIYIPHSPLPLKIIPNADYMPVSTNGFRTILSIDGTETDISNKQFFSLVALAAPSKIITFLNSV